jgi:hypothetical protein
MRLLCRLGEGVQTLNLVMLTVERHDLLGEECLADLHGLGQACQALARCGERQPRLPVISQQPPSSQTQLQPAVAEHVYRGRFFCEDRRMPKVVVQHHCTEA